jgi:hypothetical protein
MKFLIALVLITATSSLARGQEAPAVQIRSAFGASHYLHGDLDYTAPALLVSARIGSGTFALEPEFAVAWHEDTQTFNLNTSATTSMRFQSVGVNAIGRSRGAISGYGGGGIGFYGEYHRYRLNDPASGYGQSDTRGPRLGAQGLAGVDVPITSRLKAFGQFRYEVRSFEDPGGGSVVQGFAGVAITLK